MGKWLSYALLPLLLVTTLVTPVSAAAPSPDAIDLNDRAVAIITSGSEDVEKLERALLYLREALFIEPEYLAAQANKLNVLLQLRRFELAYDAAQRVAELTEDSSGKMFVCFLEEAFGLALDDPFTCYAQVAMAMRQEMGAQAEDDLNYLFALKMAEADNFNATAERFLSRRELDAERETYHKMLIEDSRYDFLADIVPNRPGIAGD